MAAGIEHHPAIAVDNDMLIGLNSVSFRVEIL